MKASGKRIAVITAAVAGCVLTSVAGLNALSAQAGAAARTAAATDAPTLSGPIVLRFTPTRGPIGTEVTIIGTGFSSSDAVTFDGVATSSPSVNATGTRMTAPIPLRGTSGVITVTDPVGRYGVNVSPFTVTQGLVTNPEILHAGEALDISGSAFPPSSDVTLRLDGAPVATIDVDAGGFVSYAYTVPASVPLGQHVLGAGHSRVTFSVVPPDEALVAASTTAVLPTERPVPGCTVNSLVKISRRLTYEPTVHMVVGQQQPITAVIGKSIPKGTFPVGASTKTVPYKTLCVVQAHLVGGTLFKVTSVDPSRQNFILSSTAQWVWEVTPNQAGSPSLILQIGSVYAGSSTLVGTYTATIHVKAAPASVSHEIADVVENPLFLTLLPLIVGGGGLASLFRRRRRNARPKEDPPADPTPDRDEASAVSGGAAERGAAEGGAAEGGAAEGDTPLE